MAHCAVNFYSGLGFYRRARMLHKGAKIIVNEYNGKLPESVKELMTIPGIGRYTASAIASIAYNISVPVVDGNVCRVLSRLKGIANNIKAPIFKDKLGWELADQIIKANGNVSSPGEINQALMELGATYCAPSGTGIEVEDPLRGFYLSTKLGLTIASELNGDGKQKFSDIPCSQCELCQNDGLSIAVDHITKHFKSSSGSEEDALRIGHSAFPLPPPKKEKREDVRSVAVICLKSEHLTKWLMIKRPSDGLLSNQWEFPAVCLASKIGDVATVSKSSRIKSICNFLSDVNTNGPSYLHDAHVMKFQIIFDTAITHIFSHVRHTSWVHYKSCVIDHTLLEEDKWWYSTDGKQELRLMSEENMKDVGITSEVKKILIAVQKAEKDIEKHKGKSATQMRKKAKNNLL